MTADVLVRPLEPRDYGAVRRIDLQEGQQDPDWRSYTEAQREYILRETHPSALDIYAASGFSFVCECDGQVVGYVLSCVMQRGTAPVVYIRVIFVREPYRRRGMAAAMYEALSEVARARAMDHVFAAVRRDNVPSLQLHEKAGFYLSDEIVAQLDVDPVRRALNA